MRGCRVITLMHIYIYIRKLSRTLIPSDSNIRKINHSDPSGDWDAQDIYISIFFFSYTPQFKQCQMLGCTINHNHILKHTDLYGRVYLKTQQIFYWDNNFCCHHCKAEITTKQGSVVLTSSCRSCFPTLWSSTTLSGMNQFVMLMACVLNHLKVRKCLHLKWSHS